MKLLFIISLIYTITISNVFSQTSILIDHNCIELSQIPVYWMDAAKSNLHIGYGHTSHGSQITSGMNAIESYYPDGSFNWSHEGGENELNLFEGDGYGDGYLDHDIGYSGWDAETREYLNAFSSCNVIIWSWCGQVNDVDLQTHLFEPMEQLETDYPEVRFVYMTGHLEGLGPDGSLFTANQQIRDYCIANKKILFDFADIEKYAPFGSINFQEFYADDNCDYDPDGETPLNRTQNWAVNWLDGNPSHEFTQISGLCSSCAHSISLNCVKKGIAAWYLWARLAGWDGTTQQIPVTSITLSSEGEISAISVSGGTLQLYAEVLPANATNPDVLWSVQNGTGQATVSSAGLVTAVANGTVTITASATDGSGVSDTFAITISNQTVLVSDISITSTGEATSITEPGGTLQLYAEVLPADATDPAVLWSVQNGTGQATISSVGLVTAVANGTVTITASATDGSGVSDAFIITISNQIFIPVEEIIITSENGSSEITTSGTTLQLFASVLPENATIKTYSWELVNVTGQASINSSGLVTPEMNGNVYAKATALDGSDVFGYFVICISGQIASPVIENIQPETFIVNISIGGKQIQVKTYVTQISQIRLINLSGNTVTYRNIYYYEDHINLPDFSPGIYFIQFISDNSIHTKKIFLP